MKFSCDGKDLGYNFIHVPLLHESGTYKDVFKNKNNKTVKITLKHPRYKKLEDATICNYSQFLDWPLGEFLIYLKRIGDDYYKRFLHRYGDSEYSKFFIIDQRYFKKKGIYIYSVSEQIKYIGRSTDSMNKRINQGHGKIHPMNCYLNGQATNCHLNALITDSNSKVSLWLHAMDDIEKIKQVEKWLIRSCNPPWNIALKRN